MVNGGSCTGVCMYHQGGFRRRSRKALRSRWWGLGSWGAVFWKEQRCSPGCGVGASNKGRLGSAGWFGKPPANTPESGTLDSGGSAFTIQTWQRLLALSCSTGATIPPARSIYTVRVRKANETRRGERKACDLDVPRDRGCFAITERRNGPGERSSLAVEPARGVPRRFRGKRRRRFEIMYPNNIGSWIGTRVRANSCIRYFSLFPSFSLRNFSDCPSRDFPFAATRELLTLSSRGGNSQVSSDFVN